MTRPERTKPVHVPDGGPPKMELPPPAILEELGEDGVFALLAAFYVRLEDTELRPWFPADMREASEHSAAFFVQVMGGRPLFVERHGTPRMRMRHIPFEIDEHARRVWLDAFDATIDEAIEKGTFPGEHAEAFRAFLDGFSSWMVNVAPEAETQG